MNAMKRTVAIVMLLVLTGALGACAGSDSGNISSGGDADVYDDSGAGGSGATGNRDVAEESVAFSGGGALGAPDMDGGDEALGASDVMKRLPAAGPKVIKTADVRVEVARESFREALTEAVRAAGSAGGYVLTSEVGKGRNARSGTITLRVPSERFETTLEKLKSLGETRNESVTGEDISEEFVDLESRLRNLEAQEAVLLRLMNRAQTVSGTIRVQRELSGVQLQIERLRGRIRFLEDQASFSTITARFTEKGAAAPQRGGTIAKAWGEARAAAAAVIAAVIVSAGFLAPLLLLLLVAAAVWKLLAPRIAKARAI
jgi:hypothetical protein